MNFTALKLEQTASTCLVARGMKAATVKRINLSIIRCLGGLGAACELGR